MSGWREHLLYLGGALGGATVGLYQNGGCNESLTRYPLSLKMASFLRESTPYTIVSSAQQCAGLFYYRKGDETDDEQETVPPDVAKVDFILTLLDKIIGENGHLQPEDRSLIGQSLKRIYTPLVASGYTAECPTLKDLYAGLDRCKNTRARQLALMLDIFANGSLQVFAHKTNVDMNNRLICFNIQSLGTQLRSIAMTSLLEFINMRVMANCYMDSSAATWVYFDEIHVLLKDSMSADFLNSTWKRFRKYNAYATGITQDIQDYLANPIANALLSNSEFVIMLRQTKSLDALEEETTTYVWKLNVHKYALDSTNHEVALSGAKFVLYRKNSVSQEEYATINNNNKITGWVTDKGRATTLETSGAGDILIEGLNVGTYYLEETEAPAGYNKLTEPIEVKITATPDATGVSETVEYRNQNDSTYTPATNAIVKVLNKAGTQLPSTGGIGTTLFYVIGGGLMAVAAVLLVTKKRMNNK